MTTSYRTSLLHLLSRISFKLGDFTLSSGAKSDYYIDCRTTTLHAEGGRLTGLAILELLREQQAEAGGSGRIDDGRGSDRVQCSLRQRVACAGAPWRNADSWLPGAQGGEDARNGTADRRISGEGRAGIDCGRRLHDGASTITAIEAAKEAGMKVIAAACLVEREEAKGRPAVEAACEGAPFLSLFTAHDVRAAHVAQMAM